MDGLRPHVVVSEPKPDLMSFISKFKWMMAVLKDYDACQRIAYENVEDARREGIDYIELRFSPWFMAEAHNLDPEGVVEAVCDGVDRGRRDFSQEVKIIGIISRTYGETIAWKELGALLSNKEDIVALDLAGDEANFPGELFLDHMKQALQAGWHITVHAGEAAGAESIWQALDQLGAERIGHAVAAIKDSELMAFMAEKRIGIECNLTSNVQTSTVIDYASHPMRTFLECSIPATINTDSPVVNNIDLAHEYNIAAPAAGLSLDQIQQAQRNALEVAFLSDEEKNVILAKNNI